MKVAEFNNRPVVMPARTRIYDFEDASGICVRVSVRLREAANNNVIVDAQAFEVNAKGEFVSAPDGRPSRTGNTEHTIATTSLGNTHTLGPGWVRVIGSYDAETFEAGAPRVAGKPEFGAPPDAKNPSKHHYDTETGIGYRWDAGEVYSIAEGKAEELVNIVRNSNPLSGLDF